MGTPFKVMLAPPDFVRRVDIPEEAVKDRLEMGWKLESAPDYRGEYHRSTPNRHKGRPAFVCATGPSAAKVNPYDVVEFVRVMKCVSWVVNDPDRVLRGDPFPAADYLVVLDSDYWSTRRADIGKYLLANPFTLPVLNFDPPENLRYQKIAIDTSTEPGAADTYQPNHYFYGRSGGIAAIQMAMHCGCNPIFLLGHDCCAADGRSHSYGVRRAEEVQSTKEYPHGYPQGPRDMLAAYAVLASHARQLGVRIVNLSQISLIDSFERSTFKRALTEFKL